MSARKLFAAGRVASGRRRDRSAGSICSPGHHTGRPVGRAKYLAAPGWEHLAECSRCGSTVSVHDFERRPA